MRFRETKLPFDRPKSFFLRLNSGPDSIKCSALQSALGNVVTMPHLKFLIAPRQLIFRLLAGRRSLL